MDADPRLRIASRWYSRRLPIALLVFSQTFLRVLQNDFSFLAYPTNYLESHPPDRGTRSRQARRFQMNGDRAGRGTVQRPVSEFRIVMAGATGLQPGPTA